MANDIDGYTALYTYALNKNPSLNVMSKIIDIMGGKELVMG